MDKIEKTNNMHLWLFFGLVFFFTWVCWIPAGLLPSEEYGRLAGIMHYAGGVMPTIVTLWLLYRRSSMQDRKDYWQRLIDVKRIGKAWYAVIFLTVPILTVVGNLGDLFTGGKGGKFGAVSHFVSQPMSLIWFIVFTLLFGPLPEEMAWRGYSLDGLQKRWNAISSSLILGVIWTVWHLPLFLIEGSYQHGLGIGTLHFWLYMLDKVPQTILMTWIYNNNRRSTVSAVLFHFMINLVGESFDLSQRGEVMYIASWWIMAFVVTTIWKPQRLVMTTA